ERLSLPLFCSTTVPVRPVTETLTVKGARFASVPLSPPPPPPHAASSATHVNAIHPLGDAMPLIGPSPEPLTTIVRLGYINTGIPLPRLPRSCPPGFR